MTYTCRVSVPSNVPGPPDETGWRTNPVGSVIYGPDTPILKGKCRFRMGGTISGSSSRDVGEDRTFTSSPILSVPVSAPLIPVGAVAEIVGVPADDPAAHLWMGLRMRVIGRILVSEMTAQRVTVEVVTG